MAGVMTHEGKQVVGQVVFKTTSVDRDATLKLGLFTNASGLSEASALAAITVPTGTGYAAKTLTDATWDVTNHVASYAKQTFTGGAGGWTGSIYGYYIYTVAGGGTARLLWYEIDASGPYTINENDTYDITLNVTIA
jgi:hypothetical protein